MREGLAQDGAEPTALAVSSQRPSPLKWKVVLVFKDSKPTHHRDTEMGAHQSLLRAIHYS